LAFNWKTENGEWRTESRENVTKRFLKPQP